MLKGLQRAEGVKKRVQCRNRCHYKCERGKFKLEAVDYEQTEKSGNAVEQGKDKRGSYGASAFLLIAVIEEELYAKHYDRCRYYSVIHFVSPLRTKI